GTWSCIVPDGLWEIAKPLIPEDRVRPQGGGTQNTPDETLFAAIIYVLVSGCSWRAMPPADVIVAVSQAEGRRWSTLEGAAVIKDDPQSVTDAEVRYAQRYKQPRPNPERVVIEIRVAKAMGTAKPPGW
ncbi:Putative transposase of IS4/5 family (DUF4096), partial [Streptomyces sp. SceaMP-e96]